MSLGRKMQKNRLYRVGQLWTLRCHVIHYSTLKGWKTEFLYMALRAPNSTFIFLHIQPPPLRFSDMFPNGREFLIG